MRFTALLFALLLPWAPARAGECQDEHERGRLPSDLHRRITHYTNAIRLCTAPDERDLLAASYWNRASNYAALDRYAEAEDDLVMVIQTDPGGSLKRDAQEWLTQLRGRDGGGGSSGGAGVAPTGFTPGRFRSLGQANRKPKTDYSQEAAKLSEETEELLKKTRALMPPPEEMDETPDEIRERAVDQYNESKDRAGAIRALDALIGSNPSFVSAYASKAWILCDAPPDPAGLKAYGQAIRLDAKNHYYYRDRGVCREELGDWAGAVEDMKTAKKLMADSGKKDFSVEAMILSWETGGWLAVGRAGPGGKPASLRSVLEKQLRKVELHLVLFPAHPKLVEWKAKLTRDLILDSSAAKAPSPSPAAMPAEEAQAGYRRYALALHGGEPGAREQLDALEASFPGGFKDLWFRLAEDFYRGRDAPKDLAEAAKWYRRAAEAGHAVAQINLGVMYHTGEGVARDPVEAHRLYARAAAQGNALGRENLAAVRSAMTAEQIAAAEGRSGAPAPQPLARAPRNSEGPVKNDNTVWFQLFGLILFSVIFWGSLAWAFYRWAKGGFAVFGKKSGEGESVVSGFCPDCCASSTSEKPAEVGTDNGFGHIFYGGAGRCGECGSVGRTLWFVIAHIPIYPVGSYRYKEVSQRIEGDSYSHTIKTEFLSRRTGLNLLQIALTYIAAIIILGVAILLITNSSQPRR